MAVRPKQVVTLAVHAQESLRVAIAAKSAHFPFTSTAVFMGNLGSIVGVAVLAMRHRRHDFAFRRAVAAKLVGRDIQWQLSLSFQKLAKEPPCCFGVLALLNQNIQHVTVLVDRHK